MFGHYYPGRAYPGEAGESPTYTLAAETGTYAITGSASGLRRALRLTAAVGVYAIAGVAAGLKAARIFAAAAGVYALTGSVAALKFGYLFACDAGEYVITGIAAGFRRALRFVVDPGNYTVSGAAANLRAARIFAAAAGAYAITGVPATMRRAYRLMGATGAYALTGLAATFKRALRFPTDVGAYVLTGLAAILRLVTATTVRVYIGGVDQSDYVRLGSLEVEDVLNDAPNRCTFTVTTGYVPQEGQVVIVTRGVTEELEFAGHIIRVQQFYEGILQNVAYHVTGQDYTWKLNRRLVTKRWTNVSATTIAQEIISGFTSGFTASNVVAGLATVAEFECRLEEPSRALTRLCAEIGGNWYVDYELDLHLFITESADAPDDISDATLATTTARGLAHVGDLGLVRTRVTGTGGGSTTGESVAVSGTSMPVEDATMFESGGGSFISKANIGTYTGRHLGGTAGTVAGNVTAPGASAPSAAVASGVVGQLAGNYAYKVAFGNSQGETIPGNASNTATGVAFAAPSGASVAASGAIGKLLGVYLYVVTYVTSLGETTAGSSFGRSATAVAAPGALAVGAGSTIGQLIGAYGYKVTFKTPYGETAAGTLASRTAVATTTPAAPSAAAVSNTFGNLIGAYGYKTVLVSAFGASAASTAGSRTAVAASAPSAPGGSNTGGGPLVGSYGWKVSFVDANGREVLGSANTATLSTVSAAISNVSGTAGSAHHYRVSFYREGMGETAWSSVWSVGSGNHTITVSGLPTDCGWKLYSTGYGYTSSDPYYHVATIAPNVTSYTHTTATGSEAQSPAAHLGQFRQVTSIPTGPTGTVARRIYRTKAGGSEYFLVGTIGDNTTTSYTDRVFDDYLTTGAPVTNLIGQQHTVSSVATGPTGTVARDIYRTEAGGSTYYFLRRIGDNSTTSFTDNATDAELNKGLTAPSTATMGDQHALTSIPTGPSGTLSRVIYRTVAGGSIYYRLVEIGDNVTTSFTDNIADVALGADVAPSASTAGGEQHSLTVIPTGPTGTLARRIYRTQAGASAYQFVGQLTDNTSTTFTDNVGDAELGGYVPVVNTAGANKIAVSSIPTGGTGVTKRILYRTEAGGSVYKYVATLNDNVTTTYTDNTPDTSLGREALTVGTIGAMAGDTTLTLESASGFPSPGWVRADSQLIYYAGISSNTLTGIPASGVGALLSPIRGGLSVVTAPFLSGVTGIAYAIEKGDEVRLYVQRNDTSAQTALAALEGGDGIHEAPIDDRTIITVAGLNAACDAELAAYSSKLRTITFRSRDPKLRSGKTITLDLGAPTNQSGDFLIQRVISTEFDTAAGLNPMRDVIAAPVLVSFQDVLRRARNTQAA
ncbi:MAG: hypothetical protein AB7I50_00470 [Vicinamibacterales bacterium]